MIKPVKILETVTTTAGKIEKAVSETPVNNEINTKPLTKVQSDTLKAYAGIVPQRLFSDFDAFAKSTRAKLAEFEHDIPQQLYKTLSDSIEAKDLSLLKKVSLYYAGLNKCSSLDEVRKMYPEIKLPEKSPLEITTADIKRYIPVKTCEMFKSISDADKQNEFFDKFFDSIMAEQIKKSDAYSEILKIRENIKKEILLGNFSGNKDLEHVSMPYRYGNTPQISIITRLLQTDYEKVMIEILRRSYIRGERLADINIKTPAFEFNAMRVRRQYPFSILDKDFKKFIALTQKSANEFKALNNLSKSEISSEIMTRTWRTSCLRRDLGNETQKGKTWSIIKAVWQKSMFPETSIYPTDKLIDTYLINLFVNGKIYGAKVNPLAKYCESPYLDKSKIQLLKRLYHGSRTLNEYKSRLESTAYKEFKAKFDIEEMSKSIEQLEKLYKNVFFKKFWTDDRKLRFTQSLHENTAQAKENIKISDEMLTDALTNVFAEV